MAIISTRLAGLVFGVWFIYRGLVSYNNVRQSKATDYDIIVVGGGAGGLVAATKFAEAGMKTLLLERGGPMLYRDGNREIPFWSLQKYAGNNLTRHDAMAYSSTHFQRYPDSRSYYCNNIPLNQLAACQLGGGTAINGAQQFCPPRQYIDTAFGFAGWTFLDFKHAIRRVAARIPPTTYWSTDHKYYYDQVYDIMKPFLESLGLLEINPLVDVDAKYDTFGRDVFAASGGQRGGPLVGYLPDAQRLSHFTLKLNSKVTRVVRTDEDIKGVEVNGTRLTAKAVVLSAGVWNTVALLFASGIGPLYELKRAAQLGFNIYPESEWIINNAVGANLHDNPSTTISLTWHDKDSVPAYDWTGAFVGKLVEADADLLFKNRTGPLTGFGRVLSGWMKVIHPEKDDISMVFQITCSTPAIQNGSFNCQFTLNEGALSRGQVSLGADGNLTFRDGSGPWLTDSERHDVSVYAIALKRFVDGASTFPGLSITSPPAGLSLAEYELYLGLNANRSNNHWGGSCTLGLSDGTAGGTDCANINAMVFGTRNLFVVDGSLSPAPTTSNPAFLYEVIADLASEKILAFLNRELMSGL